MTAAASPYHNRPTTEWSEITQELIDRFPLSGGTLVEIVKEAWEDLYTSTFGRAKLVVGTDVFLPAQATGVILEKLIVLELIRRDKGWRSGAGNAEKDVVCTTDAANSFEIKTSSSQSGLYGNRSTGHRAAGRRKFRTGYYLVINYKLPIEENSARWIWSIRFGWIDDEDWTGQAQPTGQQASVSKDVARLKLVELARNI